MMVINFGDISYYFHIMAVLTLAVWGPMQWQVMQLGPGMSLLLSQIHIKSCTLAYLCYVTHNTLNAHFIWGATKGADFRMGASFLESVPMEVPVFVAQVFTVA